LAPAGSRENLAFPISDYTAYPESVTGRIFFHDPGDGKDYACSGSAVNSPNLSVVWTAGHCAYDTTFHMYMTNWVFVPQYHSGSAPQGVWQATQLFTVSGWTDSASESYDMAAAVVSHNGQGATLVDTVGGLGIQWNQPNQQTFTALGYPADPAPYNGSSMLGCTSAVVTTDPNFSPNPLGINCDMGHGSSGGPWIVGDQYLNANTAYGYSSSPGTLFGPYFGTAAATIFGAAGSVGAPTPSPSPTASPSGSPTTTPPPTTPPPPPGGGGGGGGGGGAPDPSTPAPSPTPTSEPSTTGPPTPSPSTPAPSPIPTTTTPPTVIEHHDELTIHLDGHIRAHGRLRSLDDFLPCVEGAWVGIYRRGAGKWRFVKKTFTDGDGFYSVHIPERPGDYLAFARAAAVDATNICAETHSESRTQI
jgi:V8-like Glu-specific endopeptidase